MATEQPAGGAASIGKLALLQWAEGITRMPCSKFEDLRSGLIILSCVICCHHHHLCAASRPRFKSIHTHAIADQPHMES